MRPLPRLRARQISVSLGGRRGLLTQAWARGPSEPPLLEDTVADHFGKIVSDYGDRHAVISRHQKQRLTYHELDLKSNSLARGLQESGVGKGDRVAVFLGNNIEYSIATYALFKLGAILVPLNPAFNAPQVISALTHLRASHLVISTETTLPFKAPRSNIPLFLQLIPNLTGVNLESPTVPSLKCLIVVDNSSGRVNTKSFRSTTSFLDLLNGPSSSALGPRNLSNNDIVNIQFTSGTTSHPKAACLSHRSILNNGHQIGSRMLLTSGDIVCCPPPLFHCFGCILGFMATATHGSAIVFPSEAFDPKASLLAVQEEKATALYGVPTMFLAELELLADGTVKNGGFEQLRTGIAAGSPIPAEVMRKLHSTLNLTELTICYGMTETSPVSCMTTTDDPMDRRINSVGKPMPHVEAKIVDPADGKRILAFGERGELAVSGYLVMKGYWDQPEKSEEVLRADNVGKMWMHTGDEAAMDDQGYVSITGRIKDLIIRGGENIHPLEVENCLFAHPGVKEVSVVGLPDEKYGEVVAAFIVARDVGDKCVSREEIRSWVREQLSHHLAPSHIFYVEGYPKTASGKIQKFKLKEMGIELLRKVA